MKTTAVDDRNIVRAVKKNPKTSVRIVTNNLHRAGVKESQSTIQRRLREQQYTVPDKSLVAWVQIDLKCPSNIFLINIFFQEMAHFNPNSFWNNVLVQNETVEKYSNVHSLVKPIESIFAKTKVLSPCHMMHPILD